MIGKSLLIFLISTVLLSSCQDEVDAYNFVGDSIIARWPIDETLPSQVVFNYGNSGSGITYIRSLSGKFFGTEVAVLIGTNDYRYFKPEKVDNYVRVYLDAINQLTDRNIYLFSVLPREFKKDDADINVYIANFNSKIKEALSDYPNIIYIDVFEDFMKDGHINYQYYSDGLHLNIYGYTLLSSTFLKTIY
ncbi:MAG: hypothetical protein K2J15_05960 [Muribaculaceae bacterium]|nr:hypothetical protein [Muribaculaceae bacterium]